MGVSSHAENQSPYVEEKQSLWVQVLPYIHQEQWTFKNKSPYPRHLKQSPETTETPIEKTPPPPPPPTPELRADELKAFQIGWLELLIRKKWVVRKDVYKISEWKKAHRQAVRALHPDTGAQASTNEFVMVHEAFKSLEGHFKVY